jgi:hypothetical protein
MIPTSTKILDFHFQKRNVLLGASKTPTAASHTDIFVAIFAPVRHFRGRGAYVQGASLKASRIDCCDFRTPGIRAASKPLCSGSYQPTTEVPMAATDPSPYHEDDIDRLDTLEAAMSQLSGILLLLQAFYEGEFHNEQSPASTHFNHALWAAFELASAAASDRKPAL